MSTSGSSMIYLDNAATSFPKAPGLGRAMAAQIDNFPGNPGRGTHAAALAADRLLFDARDSVARAIGAPEPARLIFTKSATEALNIVLFGLLDRGPLGAPHVEPLGAQWEAPDARQPAPLDAQWEAANAPQSALLAAWAQHRSIFAHRGDRSVPLVVTSSYEHNAVMRPLRWLEKYRGVQVLVLPFDEAGRPDEAALTQALSLKPDLAVFTMASNVTGVVLPWEELAERFHRVGSLVCLDGSQYIGHFPFEMSATPADYLCFPGHKGLLGPTGIGGLYLAGGPETVFIPETVYTAGMTDTVGTLMPEPLIMGGTGSHSLSEEQPTELPDRFEAGTQNLAGAAGLLHAVNFVTSVGLDEICRREAELTLRLASGLSAISGIHVYGPPFRSSESPALSPMESAAYQNPKGGAQRHARSSQAPRHAPVVSFRPENLHLDVFATELDKRGVVARHGLHCAPEAHKTIGSLEFGGTVRLSPGYFTTEQEIDEVLRIVAQIVKAS